MPNIQGAKMRFNVARPETIQDMYHSNLFTLIYAKEMGFDISQNNVMQDCVFEGNINMVVFLQETSNTIQYSSIKGNKFLNNYGKFLGIFIVRQFQSWEGKSDFAKSLTITGNEFRNNSIMGESYIF